MRIRRVLPLIVLAACGYDWTVIPAPSTTSNEGGAAPPKPGGTSCKADKDCGPDAFCAFPDRLCGAGKPGACASLVPATKCAGAKAELACTCTGDIVKSRCQASSLGKDLGAERACSYNAPETFRCGFLVCPTDTYCVETTTNGAVDYECVDWTCVERTCACKETSAECAKPVCGPLKGGGTVVRCTN